MKNTQYSVIFYHTYTKDYALSIKNILSLQNIYSMIEFIEITHDIPYYELYRGYAEHRYNTMYFIGLQHMQQRIVSVRTINKVTPERIYHTEKTISFTELE